MVYWFCFSTMSLLSALMWQCVCSQLKNLLKHFPIPAGRPIGEEIRTKKPPGRFEWVCMDRFNVRSCQNYHWFKQPGKWRANKCQTSVQGVFRIDPSVRMKSWRSGFKSQSLHLFSSIFCILLFFLTLKQMVSFSSIVRRSFRKVDDWLAESSRNSGRDVDAAWLGMKFEFPEWKNCFPFQKKLYLVCFARWGTRAPLMHSG